jgi:CheY-like chemotaxis protein
MQETLDTNICPPKLKELIDSMINKLNEDCTSLLGRNFGISKPNSEIVTLRSFIDNNTDGNYYLINSELSGYYQGNICTILKLSDVIKISSVLLGSEDKEIKEKVEKGELDADGTDGIMEFSRQYSSIIESAIKNKLPKDVHVKLSTCTAIDKDNASEVVKDIISNEYINLKSLLLIKGFETEEFNMLFPIESVEEFFGEAIHEKSTNVLIVDDSLTDIRIIRKYLTNTAFHVISAHNAKQAFGILQKEKIHLILMDLNLPEQSGTDICKSIKKTPYTRGIPLIMISAHPTQEAVVESLQVGARDFLVKPFSKEKLLQRIDKFKTKEKLATLY